MVNRILPTALEGEADSDNSVSASACCVGGPNQEKVYSRMKIQYYRIALACRRVRRRQGKSVAEKIFCSVMSCSADFIL